VSESSEKNGGIFDIVVPETISSNKEAQVEFNTFLKNTQKTYDRLLAYGVTKQDARFVLPGGACTNFVTTLNLRSFMDVYDKRVVTPGAQWEIKEMLLKMRDLIVSEEPWLDVYFLK